MTEERVAKDGRMCGKRRTDCKRKRKSQREVCERQRERERDNAIVRVNQEER